MKETKQVKTIGVLTSGGDAPGMNAAIRSTVRTALDYGMRVMGIRRGYEGLINGDMYEMNLRTVSDILQKGGTVLYTARCPEFETTEGVQRGVKTCSYYNIDGLITIGGDGTFCGANELSKCGVPCIGVPATIDNDVSSSEVTIGFDTAINTVVEMVDKLRDTSQSHNRCSIVEVMGRKAGHIALQAGIAVGASVTLVPEIPFDMEKDVFQKMRASIGSGRRHFIVIVAEGVGGIQELAKEIHENTGVETRTTILGHVQRGGSPTARDRVLATRMGHRAAELLSKGISGKIIASQSAKIVALDMDEALNEPKRDFFDYDLYEMNRHVSI